MRRGTIVFKGLDKDLEIPSRWHKENLIKSFVPSGLCTFFFL